MNEKLIKEITSIPDVRLVAVTKKHTSEEIDELARLGLDTFGENRVQEFLTKYDPKYHWHIIGHLQTNKVKYIIGKVDLIESVDSVRLAKEIDKQAAKAGLVQDILIEVKVSKSDLNKTGMPLDEFESSLEEIQDLKNIRIRGLMTIATNTDDRDLNRKEFEAVKALYDETAKVIDTMDTLSMGMSADWKDAVACGSNQVRVGTALFIDSND